MNTQLHTRLAEVDARIAEAVRAAGRAPESVTRIVVTKFHPAQLVRDLYELGVRDVGENRQQELTQKRADVAATDLRWHAIGQVQTNKARAVRASADVVHCVDRVRLANSLHAAATDESTLDVLVQLNLTDDPARGGVHLGELDQLVEHVLTLSSLNLRGLMAVAPLPEEEAAASAFDRLARAAERVRAIAPEANWLSAGMSHDFVEAVNVGATHLRIGSAITGPRPQQG